MQEPTEIIKTTPIQYNEKRKKSTYKYLSNPDNRKRWNDNRKEYGKLYHFKNKEKCNKKNMEKYYYNKELKQFMHILL